MTIYKWTRAELVLLDLKDLTDTEELENKNLLFIL